jgi:hypothetical protein
MMTCYWLLSWIPYNLLHHPVLTTVFVLEEAESLLIQTCNVVASPLNVRVPLSSSAVVGKGEGTTLRYSCNH